MNILIPQIHRLTGGTEKTRRLYELGAARAAEALSSPEIKEAILSHKFNGELTYKLNFHSYSDKETSQIISRSFTNKELYKLIISGWDKFNQTEDGDIDIEAELFYKRWSRAIGYTYPSTLATWINTKFWIGSDEKIIAMIAGNIAHEYMHNLGFTHAFKSNPTRMYTVPYAIGTMVHRYVVGAISPYADNEYKLLCYRSWKYLWLKKTCRKVAA